MVCCHEAATENVQSFPIYVFVRANALVVQGVIAQHFSFPMQYLNMNRLKFLPVPVLIMFVLLCLPSCQEASGEAAWSQAPQRLPVLTVSNSPATTYREYSASLEGTSDVEIRPQVNGILDKIYADEGAYVKKGQPLFRINDRPYREQLDIAKAGLAAAQANLATSQINVSKISPLVQNNVVSDVQLKSAQAAYDAASAHVAQAESMVRNAEINLSYTLIKAPVDGYIGRIPFKMGSLVGLGMADPLTVLSETKAVYAYFSLSENDFLEFKNQFAGNTVEEKIRHMPPVELILADNSVYAHKGKVETVTGQFNNNTGTISFRTIFKNPAGLLRSGNTGKIRIPRLLTSTLVVPQAATFSLQDKVFVFVLADSNKVIGTPIAIAGSSGNYYLVENSLKPGEKIVFSGIDRLRDGDVIEPFDMSMDSLLQANPL